MKHSIAKSSNSITTLASREVYRNNWLLLREDQILRSNGQKGIYGVVEKHPCAVIIPIEDGKVCLVEQFRYTIQERARELPQGGWEEEVEHPEDLARGELREELGLEAHTMTLVSMHWIAYGFTHQKQYVFLAEGLSHTEKDPDPEEHDLVVHSMPIEEFEQQMLDGRIRDGCTVAAWGMYLMWNKRRAGKIGS